MANVKNIPIYDVTKEIELSNIETGRECLLQINGSHAVYQVCKVGNSPIVVNTPEHQPNKKILLVNMGSGRLVNKHPAQKVVPVKTKVMVSNEW